MSSVAVAREYEAWRTLVNELSDVQDAPESEDKLNHKLTCVRQSLAFEQSQLSELHRNTEKARADWIKVRDQTRTRLWTKLKHPAHGAERLSALVKVGENTFRDAEQKEKRCTDRIATMAAEEGKVDTQLRDVRSRVARHEVLTAQLNELYERVFHGAGNEQDFPEEDRAEAAVKLDEQRFADAEKSLEQKAEVKKLMMGSHDALMQAIGHMQSARGFSSAEPFGGGLMSDVFERNEITTAQMYLDKAATLSQQAKQLSPELQRLDRIQLPVPNFLIDLFLENAITDALFYERIANALADLEMAETVMMSQYIRRVNELVGDAKVEKNNSERELQERRKSLEKVRREILESARPNGKARM